MPAKYVGKEARNLNWGVWQNEDGTYSSDQVERAIMLDIREYLREIHISLLPLRCGNFLRIPKKLDRIGLNTEKILKGK